MHAPLRIAIATDLHYIKDSNGASLPQVCVKGTKIDPMAELLNYIELSPAGTCTNSDLIICPGDITTSACKNSFNKGWEDLKQLKKKLKAKHLIAATGNHEIVSRSPQDHSTPGNAELAIEPFEHLISTKDYPAELNTQEKWVYWGRGYEILYGENWVVVTINSCHYHNSLLPNEYERGRIGNFALEELRQSLKEIDEKYTYRIIVLHHPPLDHESFEVELGRTSMFNVTLLLQAIEETNRDWLIIHGHKHLFRLIKSHGSDYSPTILGAASFGAMLTGELANQTKNQFYIVELSTVEEDGEARLRGKFESLYWDSASWNICTNISHGLPHGCGFNTGTKPKTNQLVGKILENLQGSVGQNMTWDELRQKIEALNYLMPSEINTLRQKLKGSSVIMMPTDGVWFPQDLWVAQ